MNVLPNLFEVVKCLKKQNELACQQHAWEDCSELTKFTTYQKVNMPMREFINDCDDDKFIVIRTQKKRHTLKPNLAHRHFLYRGQNKKYPKVLSSFSRDELPDKNGHINQQKVRDKHLVANLKTKEFISLLRTHPLFMMFDKGISLDPERKPFFINMNYGGLAQHYGFKTSLVDFTTDLEVAAFFACTKNVGFDEYIPITDTKEYPTGVMYVHPIQPELTFKYLAFSVIGLQLFPRSGAQKGVLFNENIQPIPLDSLIRPIPFRHDPEVSRHFFQKMKKGKLLFPDDSIALYAKHILESKEVSGCVFAENIYSNKDDFNSNMEALEREGLHVNWHQKTQFTQEMLDDLDHDLKNGLWEEFCKQIRFVDSENEERLSKSLLSLPKNPSYAHFFKKSEYSRIARF